MKCRTLLLLTFTAALAGRTLAQQPSSITLDPHQPPAADFGFHPFVLGADIHVDHFQGRMSYLLFLPHAYVDSPDRQPLFIFLHGNGHGGNNLAGILNEGPANYLQNLPQLRDKFPMVALFPQCPDPLRWDSPGMSAAVVALIDSILATYRIDPDRVYISGLSLGGAGTWLVSAAAPDRFAMIVPICAVATDPPRVAHALHHTPTWIICGSNDSKFTDGSALMATAFAQEGAATVVLSVVPQAGHEVWRLCYPDLDFYQQLLAMRRPPAA